MRPSLLECASRLPRDRRSPPRARRRRRDRALRPARDAVARGPRGASTSSSWSFSPSVARSTARSACCSASRGEAPRLGQRIDRFLRGRELGLEPATASATCADSASSRDDSASAAAGPRSRACVGLGRLRSRLPATSARRSRWGRSSWRGAARRTRAGDRAVLAAPGSDSASTTRSTACIAEIEQPERALVHVEHHAVDLEQPGERRWLGRRRPAGTSRRRPRAALGESGDDGDVRMELDRVLAVGHQSEDAHQSTRMRSKPPSGSSSSRVGRVGIAGAGAPGGAGREADDGLAGGPSHRRSRSGRRIRSRRDP